MSLRSTFLFATCLFALVAQAPVAMAVSVDEWVPYTDGRAGGCYRSERGELYNCTRAKDDAPAPQDLDDPLAQTRAQLAEVQRELDALKQRQAAEDEALASARAEVDAAARAERELEQREIDAAKQAYNEVEAAMDSLRRQALQEKTEACRATLEKRGFRIVGPGACRAPDGSYVNCPDC